MHPNSRAWAVKYIAVNMQTHIAKNNCTVTREKEGLLAFAVAVLINFALDKNGKHLFKVGNKDALMKKTDGAVIERLSAEICSEIWGDDDEDDAPHPKDVAKKPSKETDTS